jgi:cell division septation protein DedD
LGVIVAATLFAYTSRIPIPLKVTPTRTVDDLLSRQEATEQNNDLQFQEHLRDREIGIAPQVAKEPVKVVAPNLPQSTSAPKVLEDTAQPEAGTDATSAPTELAYYVQAGAFADTEAAAKLQQQLAQAGMPATVRAASGGNLHRVVVGPYAESGEAESIRAQLALQGRATQMLRLGADAN